MKQWFNNLKHHEQWLLLVMSVLLVAAMIYNMIWQPLKDSQQQLLRQNLQAAKTLLSVKKLSQQYLALSASGQSTKATGGGSLASIVDTTVAANKLAMSRFQPSSSGDAQVRFENVSFAAVLSWLYQMETEYGVAVRDLSITKGSGSDLVNVSARVGKG